MTTTETTSPPDQMREAASAIRSHEKALPGFCDAVADLLDELARQMGAPPCNGAPDLCNNCERRDDFNDALRVAQAVLHPFARVEDEMTQDEADAWRELRDNEEGDPF